MPPIVEAAEYRFLRRLREPDLGIGKRGRSDGTVREQQSPET
jgi:hypothetical protein